MATDTRALLLQDFQTVASAVATQLRHAGQLLHRQGHECSNKCSFHVIPLYWYRNNHICNPGLDQCLRRDCHDGVHQPLAVAASETRLTVCGSSGRAHVCGMEWCHATLVTDAGDTVCRWTGTVLLQSTASYRPKYNVRDMEGFVDRRIDLNTIESRLDNVQGQNRNLRGRYDAVLQGSAAFKIRVIEICNEILSEERFRRDLQAETRATQTVQVSLDRYLAQCNSRREFPSFEEMVKICVTKRTSLGTCVLLNLSKQQRSRAAANYCHHVQIIWGLLYTYCRDYGATEILRGDTNNIRVFILAVFEILQSGLNLVTLDGDSVTLVDRDPVLAICPVTKMAQNLVLGGVPRKITRQCKRIIQCLTKTVLSGKVNPQELRVSAHRVEDFAEEPFLSIKC